MTKIITTTSIQMKTRKSFPTTLGLSEIIDRKKIMKEVNNELEKKGKYKPELTLIQKQELNKQFIEECAKESYDLEKIKELLNKGVNINTRDKENMTALIWASREGNIEIVKFLLDNSQIKINEKNINGWTALIYASLNKSTEITTLLLNDSRTEINEKTIAGGTALILACEHKRLENVKLLLKHPKIKVNEKNDGGWTALSRTIKYGYYDIISLLIDAGAEVHKSELLDISFKNLIKYGIRKLKGVFA